MKRKKGGGEEEKQRKKRKKEIAPFTSLLSLITHDSTKEKGRGGEGKSWGKGKKINEPRFLNHCCPTHLSEKKREKERSPRKKGDFNSISLDPAKRREKEKKGEGRGESGGGKGVKGNIFLL